MLLSLLRIKNDAILHQSCGMMQWLNILGDWNHFQLVCYGPTDGPMDKRKDYGRAMYGIDISVIVTIVQIELG